MGKGTTQVVNGAWAANGPADATDTPDWWKATLPAMPAGTVLRAYESACACRRGRDASLLLRQRPRRAYGDPLRHHRRFSAAAAPRLRPATTGPRGTGLDSEGFRPAQPAVRGRAGSVHLQDQHPGFLLHDARASAASSASRPKTTPSAAQRYGR
ncbi:MAG: hypothetical protein U1F87_15395 [Kiritimatiellia bacterium]